MRLWNPRTARSLLTLSGHDNSVAGVAFNSKANLAVSASLDGTIKVWDLQGVATDTVDAPTQSGGAIASLTLSSDGCYLISLSLGKLLRVWDAETLELVRKFEPPKNYEAIKGVAMNGRWAICSTSVVLATWVPGSLEFDCRVRRALQRHKFRLP